MNTPKDGEGNMDSRKGPVPMSTALGLELAGLLARVESATGADRELDGEIWCAMLGYKFMNHTSQGEGFIYWHGTRQWRGEANRLTASLDASLALCEIVLPGCLWTAKHLGEGDYAADVGRPDFEAVMHGSDVTSSPPLALLAAMLSALIASTASPEGDAS